MHGAEKFAFIEVNPSWWMVDGPLEPFVQYKLKKKKKKFEGLYFSENFIWKLQNYKQGQ